MKYVTIEAFSKLSGYTKRAIESKIQRKQWEKNRVYVKAPDGRILINIEEYEKWVEESMLDQKPQSKSRLCTTASAAVNRYRLSPRLQT